MSVIIKERVVMQLRVRYTTIILGLLVLMFLSDGATSILRNLNSGFYQVSVFVRIIVQAYFLVLLLRISRGLRAWRIMLFLYGVYFLGAIAGLTSLYSPAEYEFFENFKDVNKLAFFFICWETYRLYFKTIAAQEQLFKVFEILLLVQSLLIIVSFAFNLDIFAAYYIPGEGIRRFGYQGLIPAQNEISGFFLIAFFYFLNKLVYLRKGILEILLTTLAGLLTGTKVTLILPIVLFVYILLWFLRTRIPKTYLALIILFFLAGLMALMAKDYIVERITPTISYFRWQIEHGTLDSELAVFLTGRDYKVRLFLSDILPKYNLLNYLFGGYDRAVYSLEMDVFEVFATFGLIGGVTFYCFYLRVLLSSGGKIDFNQGLFLLVWLGVSATAGHLVFSAINGSYLPVLLLSFASFKDVKYNALGSLVYQQDSENVVI